MCVCGGVRSRAGAREGAESASGRQRGRVAVMSGLFGALVTSAGAVVSLSFDGAEGRKKERDALAGSRGGSGGRIHEAATVPVYRGDEPVSGSIVVQSKVAGKPVRHQGIRVDLVGQIELASDRGVPFEFTSTAVQLDVAGEIFGERSFAFRFDKAGAGGHESYAGLNARLRYFVRVTVAASYGAGTVKEFDLAVQNPRAIGPPEEVLQAVAAGQAGGGGAASASSSSVGTVGSSAGPNGVVRGGAIKMEVGIEDCLHIEFTYDRGVYRLGDTLCGKIEFLLVRIRIKQMDLEIRRREVTGTGAGVVNESKTIARFEVMDGSPVRGETIPIRMHLGAYPLTPSYIDVNNKFSVRYYVNLVLIDEEDRRYFKQQEIVLWRDR